MNNETNESIVDEHIYIDSKGNEVGRRIAMPTPDIKPDANPSININPNIILDDAINDAQNALKGPKFATRAALDANGNTCRGRDKSVADALFDTVYGLNLSWFKDDESFPDHYKKAMSKLNEDFKDKNNGEK